MMACCHALMNVDGELVGDPLEKAAFLASGWHLRGSSAGHECRGPFDGMQCTVRHVQKFHFSSDLKRMSVVVRLEGPRGLERTFVLAKGAPEVMQRLLAAAPEGYEAAHRLHASQGGRVISLAIKTIPSMSMSELKAMPREEVRPRLSCGHGFACMALCCHAARPQPGCAKPLRCRLLGVLRQPPQVVLTRLHPSHNSIRATGDRSATRQLGPALWTCSACSQAHGGTPARTHAPAAAWSLWHMLCRRSGTSRTSDWRCSTRRSRRAPRRLSRCWQSRRTSW